MIDEKLLLEELKERERRHMCDYDAFSDAPESQFDVAHCLQELQEVMDIVRKQPKVGEWIPCSARLPEDEKTKIVTLSSGVVESGFWNERNWWCIGDSINLETRTGDVIAWQPLPEPYKENNND